jgi:hypothetical protein
MIRIGSCGAVEFQDVLARFQLDLDRLDLSHMPIVYGSAISTGVPPFTDAKRRWSHLGVTTLATS